jgi:hypothetical protein
MYRSVSDCLQYQLLLVLQLGFERYAFIRNTHSKTAPYCFLLLAVTGAPGGAAAWL